MPPVLDRTAYLERLLSVDRPGSGSILAFYEHRVGAICHDPKLMLMPLDDHLAHRGDGIFESMKYEHGRIYQLEAHLERMARSAEGLYLEPPCTWDALREVVIDVARASGRGCGMLRVLVGRGPGGFGIDPAECPEASLYVAAYKFTPKDEAWYAKGLTAFRSAIPAKQGYLARIKNANYLPNVFMTREAHQRGMDVAFSFDEEGFLAEAAIANVALVDAQGALVVPEFSNALAGTTVLRAMELAQGEMPVTFRKVREDDLYAAREVLVLGTSSDCVGVVAFEGRPVGDGRPGPVSARLRALLQADLLASGTPFLG